MMVVGDHRSTYLVGVRLVLPVISGFEPGTTVWRVKSTSSHPVFGCGYRIVPKADVSHPTALCTPWPSRPRTTHY
eukprot:6229398-Pyramimonas_sp.AAC.1